MELLLTDKGIFSILPCTLPRNVNGKKEKHGLCDRSHEHLGMCQRQKNNDNSQ
jgi:hypothetical protein